MALTDASLFAIFSDANLKQDLKITGEATEKQVKEPWICYVGVLLSCPRNRPVMECSGDACIGVGPGSHHHWCQSTGPWHNFTFGGVPLEFQKRSPV